MKANRVIQKCSPESNDESFVKVGTQCQAKCNETGYRLIGPRLRQCLILGRWTGYDQMCVGE